MIWHLGKLRDEAPWLAGCAFGGGGGGSSSSTQKQTTTTSNTEAGADTGSIAVAGGGTASGNTINTFNGDSADLYYDTQAQANAISAVNDVANAALEENGQLSDEAIQAWQQTITQALGIAGNTLQSSQNSLSAAETANTSLASEILSQANPSQSAFKLVVIGAAAVAAIYFLTKG